MSKGDYHGERESSEADFLVSDVKAFAKKLNRSLQGRKVDDLQNLYEKEFVALTEKFYKGSAWPTAETVSTLLPEADRNFSVLYKDLYYRHLYNRLGPTVTVDDRFNSFHNYINLFNTLLGLTTTQPELSLPLVWLWDIIDEFIYQFRSFHTMRGSRRKNDPNPEEMQLLKDHPHVWSAQTVIQYLHALVNKAHKAPQGAVVAPFLQAAAEFSLIGLCRVNCLLGDYYGAVQALDHLPMDMSKRPYYSGPGASGIVACHATLHYYLAFAYMMLKRYCDAITVVTDMLNFLNRNKQWIPRSYQEANINRQVNSMLGLLAICVALHPQTLDDNVQAMLRESPISETDFLRMQAGESLAFEQIFDAACPKFINPAFPDFDNPFFEDPRQVQQKTFMAEVHERVSLSELTGILQLCNTVNTKKLATLAKKDEDTILSELISFKIKSKQLKHEEAKKAPAHGVWVHTSPLNYYFRNEVLHVSESVEVDRYAEYFMSQILKYEDYIDEARQVR